MRKLDLKYVQLVRNTLLVSIGSFSSRLLNFIFVPLYTAVLSTSEYGVADLITSSVSLAYQILTLSVAEGVMRFSLDNSRNRDSILLCGLAVSAPSIFVVSLLVVLGQMLGIVGEQSSLLIIFYTSYTVYNLFSYYARGINNVRLYSLCGALSTIVIVLSNVVCLIHLKLGIRGYIFSYALGYACAAAVLFGVGGMYSAFKSGKLDVNLIKQLIGYSAPLIPNGISWWLIGSANLYILTLVCGSSAAGLFSAANRIPSIVTAVVDMFMVSWKISSVNNFGSEESRHFFSTVFSYLMAFGSLFVSLIILFSRPLSGILLSGEFYSAWRYIPLLLVGALYNGTSNFFGSIFLAAKSTGPLFYSTLVGGIASVVLGVLFSNLFGITGASVAMLIGYIITWIIRASISRHFFALYGGMWKELIILVTLVTQGALVSSEDTICWLIACFSPLIVLVVYRSELATLIKELIQQT